MPYTWPYTWADNTATTSTTPISDQFAWTTPGTTVVTSGSTSWNCWLWNAVTSNGTWWPYGTGPPYVPQFRQPSRAELDRMEADRQFQYAGRIRVNERAEALLLSLLGPDQARSYTEAGWFEVRGSAGGRFRIRRHGQAGNVDELSAAGGDRIASYCIHPSGGFPDADAHVAQFLALVTDEEGFRRTANRTPRQLPARIAA